MPGAILLVQTPQTNFLHAVGWADVKHKIPMRTNDAFRIGSITKMFVGLTIGQLEKEGLLKTDAVITNYLPKGVTDHIANSDRITVLQLLQNRSGIRDFMDNPWWAIHYALLDRHGNWPPLRCLKFSYDKSARFAPGDRYEYSNSNFLLLALIIDQVAADHHSSEIRRRFLNPLQLTNTYYELYESARGRRAHGYETFACLSMDTYDWTPITGGGMGMVSTTSDLASFIHAVIHRPKGGLESTFPDFGDNGGIVWQRADHDKTSLSLKSVFFEPDGTSVFFGHAGIVPGYLSFVWYDIKNDITIVWFSSSTRGGNRDGFEQMLERALFDLALDQTSHIKEKSDSGSGK